MRDGWLKKSGTTPSDLKKELIQRIYVKVQLDAKVRDENKAARLGGDDDEDADAEADDEENDADIPDDAELLQTDADDAASVAAVAAAASPSVASGGMDLEFSCQDCGTTWIKPAVEVDEMKQSGFVVCCDSCQKPARRTDAVEEVTDLSADDAGPPHEWEFKHFWLQSFLLLGGPSKKFYNRAMSQQLEHNANDDTEERVRGMLPCVVNSSLVLLTLSVREIRKSRSQASQGYGR